MEKVFTVAYNECFQNKVTESNIVKLWIITVGNHQWGEISCPPQTINYSYSVSVPNTCVATTWTPPMNASTSPSNQYKAMGVSGREGEKW